MTEGLIIISNDGEVYNHVMHPRKKLYKSYIAKVSREIEDKDIEALQHGVVIDGKRTAPAKVKKIDNDFVRNEWAQGDAGFAGAEFTIINRSAEAVYNKTTGQKYDVGVTVAAETGLMIDKPRATTLIIATNANNFL